MKRVKRSGKRITHLVHRLLGGAFIPNPDNHPNKEKTHCPAGHPYDEENTRKYRGMRYCIECTNRRNRENSNPRF